MDPRLQDIITPFDGSARDVVILGFPFDEGVKRNGGRTGAKEGPVSFRKYMSRICATNAHSKLDLSEIRIADAGDISNATSLEVGHSELKSRVASILKTGAVPFVVGGGNDQSYPNASALLGYSQSVLVINIDAHLDVRPLKNNQVHSGSPFRQLLEDERFTNCKFVEFAAQGPQCAVEHVEYLESKGGQVLWFEDMANPFTDFCNMINDCKHDSIFVSFDLDAVVARDAPGVSCSSPTGLSSEDAIRIAKFAGSHPKVKLFDLSEYNPQIEEYRTGRLVAMMFHAFLCGYTQRKSH